MAINNKDDYEKLAKILYPSIEASGNVYYGQTRKLTMDEILGKNELNFESHIETFKQGDQTYKSYFNWKIGPLKGAIQVKALDNTGKVTLVNFPNTNYFTLLNYDGSTTQIADINKDIHGTVFAKYRISHVENPVANVISSASFTTYENDFYAEYIGLYIADSNLIVADNRCFLCNNDRNFFITKNDNINYIYVKVANRTYKSYYKDYIDKPFRVTAVAINSSVSLSFNNDTFKYRTNNIKDWATYASNTVIQLSNINDFAEFKIDNDATESNHPYFTFTGSVSLSGNILSLYLQLYNEYNNYEQLSNNYFSQSFATIKQIVDASKLALPSLYLGNECYSDMFNGCTNLEYPPELPATDIGERCYDSMFYGCTNLKIVPNISANNINAWCYSSMFRNCTNIEYPIDILPVLDPPTDAYISMYNGCTALKRTPIILANELDTFDRLKYQSFQDMFNGCSNLNVAIIFTTKISTFSHSGWLSDVAQNGILFVPENFDDSSAYGLIPLGWIIKHIDTSDFEDIFNSNGFYCKQAEYNLTNNYADSDLVVSGSDCELNGRGILSDETKFNMLETSPLISNNIEFGKYDPNSGSLNQEVWGIKSFNSPVLFRNGIYGECASLTTADTSSVSDFSIAYDYGGQDEYYSEVGVNQSYSAELKVLPNGAFFKPDYNPRSLIEVLHTNTGNTSVDAFKMSVCQSGLYAYNKFDDTNKIRYIDPIVNELNNTSFTGKYASFVSSASIGTNIINEYGEFDGRNEHYISVMSAGDAYIALKSDTSNHLNTLNVSCSNVNISDNGIITASQFLGKLPSISRATVFTAPDIQIGSICLVCLKPTFSSSNYYSSKSYNHKDEPFTIYAVKESSFSINCAQGANPEDIHSFKYCINNDNYEAYTSNSVINLLPGDTVKIICTHFYSLGSNVHSRFTITGNVNIYGNIGSLLSENYLNISSLSAYGDYVFAQMFYNCDGIYDASGLTLPFSTLTQYCYFEMFYQCENLISAPSIAPGTSYRSHYKMFCNCISLKNAPVLINYTTFSNGCYECMFYGCTSLEIAPIIMCVGDPQLDIACFKQMFYNCTSLLTAPILTASTLKFECYYQMFYNCTSLKYVKCLATAQDIVEPSDMHWLDNTNVNGALVLHTNSQGTTVTVSLTNPNNWSNLYVSNTNFLSNTTLYPGNVIHTGAFIYSYLGAPDSSPSDYPDIDKSNYINQIGTITIASLNSFRDNSKDILYAESISEGIFYDCKLKLLSGCVCDSTSKLYCLAMRVE